MTDLKELLKFIADGYGPVLSAGQAKDILDSIEYIEKDRDQLKVEIKELVILYNQREIINPVTWNSKLDIKINQLRQKAQEVGNAV